MVKMADIKIRSSKEFQKLINEVKISYLKQGKPSPSTAQITKKIAEKILDEGLVTRILL